MRNSKAIVTGAAGFIGSHLAEELLKRGYQVVGIDDMSAGKISNVKLLKTYPGYQNVWADVTDKATLDRVFADFEPGIIFHQAASKKNICLKDPHRDLEVNGGGTLNLLELARDYKVNKFVHASTGSVYGEWSDSADHYQQDENYPLAPVSYYGCSKLAGERYVNVFHRDHGLNTTILRYFHVYGERQEDADDLGGVIAIWIRRIRKGLPIRIFGTGQQMRSFTYGFNPFFDGY
jgi:UDP-glucose 4-epimerase